MIRW
jgi:hypothetical protein